MQVYDKDKTFNTGDIVYDKGEAHRSLRTSKGSPLSDKTAWAKHTANVGFMKSPKVDSVNVPAHVSGKIYKSGEVAKVGNSVYKATADNQAHPTDTKFWQPYGDQPKPIVIPRGEDKPKSTPFNSQHHIIVVDQTVHPIMGKDGKDGRDGVDGNHGKDGRDGNHGRDGLDGRDGKDGPSGKDAVIDKDFFKDKRDWFGIGGSSHYRLTSVAGNTNLIYLAKTSNATLKNLKAGTNVTITDNGQGTLTLAASGGGGGGSIPQANFSMLG